jgi:hypothetical protein
LGFRVHRVLDYGFLAETMENLGVTEIKVVADKGYFQIEAYVPKPLRGSAVAAGLISREEFTYGPEKEV